MKVLITGASGFLGQYVVAEALRKGHTVQAVVRPMTDVSKIAWSNHPNIEWVRLDLRSSQGWDKALQTTDAVIHLVAVKSGSFDEQFTGTVKTTENLLAAMAQAQVFKLIFISTFSVYDYLHLKPGTLLDENSPLEANPDNRDEYAQTKLLQENLIRQFQERYAAKVTILRPGMIYGRGYLWHALLGVEIGENRWLKVGGEAILPLTYVENCAAAVIAAVSSELAVGRTINIIDDDLPTQNDYIQGLLKHTEQPPQLIPVSWFVIKAIAHSAWWVRETLLGGKARLPGILVPARLYARFNSLKYSNDCARNLLQWQSYYSFDEALERSHSSQDLLKI